MFWNKLDYVGIRDNRWASFINKLQTLYSLILTDEKHRTRWMINILKPVLWLLWTQLCPKPACVLFSLNYGSKLFNVENGWCSDIVLCEDKAWLYLYFYEWGFLGFLFFALDNKTWLEKCFLMLGINYEENCLIAYEYIVSFSLISVYQSSEMYFIVQVSLCKSKRSLLSFWELNKKMYGYICPLKMQFYRLLSNL